MRQISPRPRRRRRATDPARPAVSSGRGQPFVPHATTNSSAVRPRHRRVARHDAPRPAGPPRHRAVAHPRRRGHVPADPDRADRARVGAVRRRCGPSRAGLAAAETRDLLRAWAGLGYNRRALALREAARTIVREHGGRVPGTVAELERLPGVGPYTARAVAASAFGVPVAPLDVNVRRVVGRVVGEAVPPDRLQDAADGLVSRDDPRAWVDAVMDLAATVCTARAPRCAACPLAGMCRSAGSIVEPARTPADHVDTGDAVPPDQPLAARSPARDGPRRAGGQLGRCPGRVGRARPRRGPRGAARPRTRRLRRVS